MNALILLLLFLVLFELLDLPGCYEEIIVSALCFLSGLRFGYFVAGLKKNGMLTKQLSDEIKFFLQSYDNNDVSK